MEHNKPEISTNNKVVPGSAEWKSLCDVLLTYVRSESDPSWSTIVNCLRSTDVDHPDIAVTIERKYVTAFANINGKNKHHIIIIVIPI